MGSERPTDSGDLVESRSGSFSLPSPHDRGCLKYQRRGTTSDQDGASNIGTPRRGGSQTAVMTNRDEFMLVSMSNVMGRSSLAGFSDEDQVLRIHRPRSEPPKNERTRPSLRSMKFTSIATRSWNNPIGFCMSSMAPQKELCTAPRRSPDQAAHGRWSL